MLRLAPTMLLTADHVKDRLEVTDPETAFPFPEPGTDAGVHVFHRNH
jgi:hypothetical protein